MKSAAPPTAASPAATTPPRDGHRTPAGDAAHDHAGHAHDDHQGAGHDRSDHDHPDHEHAGHDHAGHAHPAGGGSHARHSHGHHHHIDPAAGDARVAFAVIVNLALTVAQVIGGVLAGSLALVADAVHNLSDAISLGIAYAARRIARRPATEDMTFGFARAEIVAALINYTTLIVIGVYLGYEAVLRFFAPSEVGGWIVVIVAGIALLIDLATVALTWRMAKTSMNIRAAFLHNLADALGSVGVLIGGTLIILFDWYIIDPIVTLGIAAYILWHAFSEIGGAIRILMQGAPAHIDQDAVAAALCTMPEVCGVHHIHLWQLDEHRPSLEAHIVLTTEGAPRAHEVKTAARVLLAKQFGIEHTTLETETEESGCAGHMTLAEEAHVVTARG